MPGDLREGLLARFRFDDAIPVPDSEGLGLKRFNALVQALTSEQRTAVAYVLRGFSDEHSDSSPGRAARAALDAHWWTYLPAGV